MVKLYSYWRSSTSYRVRIALALKGLPFTMQTVSLIKDGGEHLTAAYRAINPQAGVPALEDGGVVLTQSLAIVEYLDETHPQPPLLPVDAVGRARVRALAQAVTNEIHAVCNLRVLKYLTGVLGQSEAAKTAWYHHWTTEGLGALETLVAGHPATGRFCHGDTPGLADICLVPALANARRFAVDLTPYPVLLRIDETCRALPAFQAAAPEHQPDAVT